MRNVLVVVNDENLINRMKIIFNKKNYGYFYATEGSQAIAIADSNEISVAIIDFKMPILSGQEICEMLATTNLKMQFIFLFEADDTEEVLRFYNKYHITKIVCKEELELELIKTYIEDCMHIYYRREELVKMKEKVETVSDKYLKPMTDMSNLLNDRLKGYDYIIRIFMCCMNLHVKPESKGVKSLNIFADRIINDFIQLFLIQEPDPEVFLKDLSSFYNKPNSKKYFKFVGNDVNIEDNKYNILLALNIITICFDTFFPMYRGKIELNENEGYKEINSIYEIRYDDNKAVADRALMICAKVLESYCDTFKFARKDELIQFKAGLLIPVKEEQDDKPGGIERIVSNITRKFDTGSF